MRLRRPFLLLGACWLILFTAWLARRWWAVRILDNRLSINRDCVWHFPYASRIPGEPTWLKLLPTSSVVSFHMRSVTAEDADCAWALRVCGRLESLSIDPASNSGSSVADTPMLDSDAVRTFLTTLGPQPALQHLQLAALDLSEEEFAALLRQSPLLRRLSLIKTNYSFTDFPPLPALQGIFVYDSAISDAGLAKLLHSPSLENLAILKGQLTQEGIQQIPQHRQPALRTLNLSDTSGLTKTEASALTLAIQSACPDLSFMLNRLETDNLPPAGRQ